MLSAVVVRVVVIEVFYIHSLRNPCPLSSSTSLPLPSSIHSPLPRLILPTFALLHQPPPNPSLHDDWGKVGGSPGRLAIHKRPDIGCKTLPSNSPKGSSCRSGCQPLAATSETLPMSFKDQMPKQLSADIKKLLRNHW